MFATMLAPSIYQQLLIIPVVGLAIHTDYSWLWIFTKFLLRFDHFPQKIFEVLKRKCMKFIQIHRDILEYKQRGLFDIPDECLQVFALLQKQASIAAKTDVLGIELKCISSVLSILHLIKLFSYMYTRCSQIKFFNKCVIF